MATTIGAMKGDTRSLDNNSFGVRCLRLVEILRCFVPDSGPLSEFPEWYFIHFGCIRVCIVGSVAVYRFPLDLYTLHTLHTLYTLYHMYPIYRLFGSTLGSRYLGNYPMSVEGPRAGVQGAGPISEWFSSFGQWS